jgi:iron complex outermembrane receptor protein
LVLYGLLPFAQPAWSQEEARISPEEVELPSKHRQSIFWSPSAVTVLTREDIRTSGASSFHDLLRRVPGMDVFDMKTYYPLLGARALAGHYSNRVLLLIDGREELMGLTGAALWGSLPIDLQEVERIEVIRGPGSTLHGPNAYSAVVNVVTVSDHRRTWRELFLTGGESGHLRLVGQIQDGWKLGPGEISGGLRLALEGKRSRSDFRDQPLAPRMHGTLRYQKGQSLDLSVHAGITAGEGMMYMDMGDLGFSDALNYWVTGNAGIALGQRTLLKVHLYHMYAQSDFLSRTRLQAQGTWIADMPMVHWHTFIFDAKVHLDMRLGDDLHFLGGIALRDNYLDGENMALRDRNDLRGAAFVQVEWKPWSMLQLTGGLRLDLDTDWEAALSPRVIAVIRPWPYQAFRLGYASAFRPPSDYEGRIHADIQKYNPAIPEIVEFLASQIGNPNLSNEKVHAFEAGWRAHFLEHRLQLSIELFFNLYRDVIFLHVDVPVRMGLPAISDATIQYQNRGADIHALGAEAELAWRPAGVWTFWCNLGLRNVSEGIAGEALPGEPQLRINLGGRFMPDTGMFVDIALHYVSDYQMPLRDPIDPLADPRYHQLGDDLLLIGRSGYRMKMGGRLLLEAGLAARLPLGTPFREYAGMAAPPALRNWDISDFGGEVLARLLSFYFRGSF